MRKSIGVILCAMVCVFCLTACADYDGPSGDSETKSGYGETDSEDLVNEETGWLTIEEADAYAEDTHCNIFILRNDMFYPIDAVELAYNATSTGALETIGMTYSDKEDVPVVEICNGDLLVTFEYETEYTFQQVESTRYCLPIGLNGVKSWGLDFYSKDFHFEVLPCEYHSGTTEVNGIAVDEDLFDRLDRCYLWEVRDGNDWYADTRRFIAADSPTTLTGGYYSGTQWHEYDICINALTYFFPEDVVINVKQTKNGYFILDTSDIAAGEYVVNDGDNWSRKFVVDMINQ